MGAFAIDAGKVFQTRLVIVGKKLDWKGFVLDGLCRKLGERFRLVLFLLLFMNRKLTFCLDAYRVHSRSQKQVS